MKGVSTLLLIAGCASVCPAATLYFQDFSSSSPVSSVAGNNPVLNNVLVTTGVIGEQISGGSSSTQSTNGDYTITMNTVSADTGDGYVFNPIGDAGFKAIDSRYTFLSGNISFTSSAIVYTGTIKLYSKVNSGNEFFSLNSITVSQDSPAGPVYIDVDFNYYADIGANDDLELTTNFGVSNVTSIDIAEASGEPLGANLTGAAVYRHYLIPEPTSIALAGVGLAGLLLRRRH